METQAHETPKEPNIFKALEEQKSMISGLIAESKRQRFLNDDLWSLDEIADYMKITKKHLHNKKICDAPNFPKSIPLPTGGKRWLAKEIRKWIEKRRG